MADPGSELRLLGRVDHLGRVAGQDDRAAVVVLVNDGLHAPAGRVGCRVDVSDQPDHGSALCPGQGCEDVPVLGELDILEPELAQLLDEAAR